MIIASDGVKTLRACSAIVTGKFFNLPGLDRAEGSQSLYRRSYPGSFPLNTHVKWIEVSNFIRRPINADSNRECIALKLQIADNGWYSSWMIARSLSP
jgi:hypothetical protein